MSSDDDDAKLARLFVMLSAFGAGIGVGIVVFGLQVATIYELEMISEYNSEAVALYGEFRVLLAAATVITVGSMLVAVWLHNAESADLDTVAG